MEANKSDSSQNLNRIEDGSGRESFYWDEKQRETYFQVSPSLIDNRMIGLR